MELSPENESRLKKVALVGALIALGSVALKNNKLIGDKIRHSSVWGTFPKTESYIIDVLKEGKEKSFRVSGELVRDAKRRIIDVTLDREDYSETEIEELEEVFSESEQAQDSLQTG